MKSWDVIVAGAGIIGLSLALALRKRSASVLLIERGEPGHEASRAAAGMLADCMGESPAALEPLAKTSARMYPEFVFELEDESGLKVDLRDHGTLVLSEHFTHERPISIAELEPALVPASLHTYFLQERSVDPESLVDAALKACKHRSVDIVSGSAVEEVLVDHGRVSGVRTPRSTYSAPIVVNCCGAWAGQLAPLGFPTRPVKGHMLSVIGAPPIAHVVRAPDVYLVPRTGSRLLIGATVEEAGYDKRVDPAIIQRLRDSAIKIAPAIADARILKAWTGLRPGSPDNLPILGSADLPGYYAATGHFRDGILLAPITARLLSQLILGDAPDHDLSPFSPSRFEKALSS